MKMCCQSRNEVGGEYITRWTLLEDDKDEIYQCLVEDLIDCFLKKKYWAVKSIEMGHDDDGNGAVIVNKDERIRTVYTLDLR